MPLRFTEQVGDVGNESFNFGFSFQIAFGLDGADTFGINAGNEFSIAMGGPGNDTYRGSSTSALTVSDTGGENDTIVADSVGISKTSSFAFTLDSGKHLVFGDVNSQEFIYVLNWKDKNAAIENIQLENTTVSTEFVKNNQDTLISGDLTWTELGNEFNATTPTGDQVDEANRFYKNKEAQLLANTDQPGLSTDKNIVVLSGENQTIQAPLSADVRGTAAAEVVQVQAGANVDFGGNVGDRVEFADAMTAYSFEQGGNVLIVDGPQGGTTEISLNAEVEIAFQDGSTKAALNPTGGITIEVGSETVDSNFDAEDVTLDADDVSTVGLSTTNVDALGSA